jgi:hypothetical protein
MCDFCPPSLSNPSHLINDGVRRHLIRECASPGYMLIRPHEEQGGAIDFPKPLSRQINDNKRQRASSGCLDEWKRSAASLS